MRHQGILELDRRDPLSSGFDHILRPILDLDVALGIERDDVTRLEPAIVRPAIRRVRGLVVRGGNPRPAYLQLTHRLAVARNLVPRVIPRPQLDECEWQ